MGNRDGMISALMNQGTNKKIGFDGGYFSFAFGNEIALVIDGIDKYFILNCGEKLFQNVKDKVSSGASKQELIKFWKEKSKNYEKSEWSSDFKDMY